MNHLRKKGFTGVVGYGLLQREFVEFFGSNEPRTVERYLGRLRSLEYHTGEVVVRQNLMDGKIAKFHYSNERPISCKTGLLEQLGYITPAEVYGTFRLHFDRFSKQASLKECFSTAKTQSSVKEEEGSKESMRACRIGEGGSNNGCQDEDREASESSSSGYRQHTHMQSPKRSSESIRLSHGKRDSSTAGNVAGARSRV
jgi:hypothetical protein